MTVASDPPATGAEPTVPNPQKAPVRWLGRWNAVIELSRGARPHVVLLTIWGLASGLIEAAFLVALARIGLAISEGEPTASITRGIHLSLRSALLALGLLLVVRLLLGLAAVRVQLGLLYRVITRLRREIAHAYLNASWSKQQVQPPGTLQQVVVSIPAQGGGLLSGITASIAAGLTVLAMILVAGVVSPAATIMVVAGLLLLALALRPIRERVQRRSARQVEAQIAFSNGVSRIGEFGLEMQAFGVRQEVEAEIDSLIAADAAAQRHTGMMSGLINPIYTTLAYGALVAGLAALLLLGVGQLVAIGPVVLIMLRSLGYVQLVQQGSVSLAQATPFLDRLHQTLADFESSPATEGNIGIQHINEIRFDSVGFHYTPDTPALRDVDFLLKRGEILGLIGPSGSGKSTLVQLLLGVRDPTSGRISIDGIDLTNITRSSWTSRVAYVPQEPQMISGTMADNVRFFRTGISDDQVLAALDTAQLSDMVRSLPDGIATYLGDNAQQMSGGQRQRIAIARAIVNNPDLLILDEPTSALDLESELEISSWLNKLQGRVTVVVVAHRLTTLSACNRLLVLSDGELVADGPPERLEMESDFYRNALRLSNLT